MADLNLRWLTCVVLVLALSPVLSLEAKTRKRRFKLISHSCESGCIDTYRTSDGKEVSLLFNCYTGDAASTQAEIARITSEGKVIRFSRLGNKTQSERTVMLYPSEGGKRRAAIIWYGKDDTCFTSIEGDSLSVALALEQWQRARSPLASYLK